MSGQSQRRSRGIARRSLAMGVAAIALATGAERAAAQPGDSTWNPITGTPKGTLERSQAETVRVDGRLYEVRVASTAVAGEYWLLVVRGTIVIDPDPELESQRNWNIVQPFMQRTCKGHFAVLEDHLVEKVNLYIRFRCGG
jgi:hypothetical protein